MDLHLRDKRAVVTGSTAGIGFAIAKALASEGASVAVNGRTEQRVAEAIDKLQAAGVRGKVEGLAADVGTVEGTHKLTDSYSDVDILVNNAGIFEVKSFEQIDDDSWKRFFEVNVLSGVRLSRHYLNGMRSHNWGRIVFISSESAVQILAEMIHYGMTKTAMLSVARGLAETTAGTAITVNSVLAGPKVSRAFSGDLQPSRKQT
jgi:NAD(P)-dependent dehydrogenase (short-subunit alcohol dehydrogenase family)